MDKGRSSLLMPLEQVQSGDNKAAPRCVNTRGHGTKGLASMPFDPTQVDPKPCKRCGTPFMPAASTSKPREWKRQRYCSRRCAALEKKPPKARDRDAQEEAGRTRRRPVRECLMEKIVVSDSGCWEWTGSLSDGGYAQIGADGRTRRAHRVAYELFVGPIPDGLVLDHVCRVRHCVNPEHLEPVTIKENARRGLWVELKTHCAQGHPWTEENIYTSPSGQRRCGICRRERSRARRKK